jgi:hypothetical protein
MEDLSAFSAKPRLRVLLDHFSKMEDTRQAWKVAYLHLRDLGAPPIVCCRARRHVRTNDVDLPRRGHHFMEALTELGHRSSGFGSWHACPRSGSIACSCR